jgi:protein involved in polysaccharide export with SLBB domain
LVDSLAQAILNGEIEDILLKKEDVLNIPSIYDLREEFYVKISGEVNNPGAFAFGQNMTVVDLVLKAGGFKESATASNVEIARRVKNDLSGKLAEIIILDIDQDLKVNGTKALEPLQPFDHVMIRRSPGFQREQLVTVNGEALYPGEFAISRANERISDLVKRAGGLNPYAYPKGATILRRNEFFKDLTEEEIKAETLAKVRDNINRDSSDRTESDKILAASIDKKIINSEIESQRKKGEIEVDNYRQESMKEMGKELAGVGEIGIKDTDLVGIDLENILKNPYGHQDLILREGDIITIPRELQTISMRGQVLFPTSAVYSEGKNLRHYISSAGGYTENARRSRSFVVYANGNLKRTRSVLFFKFYPNIEPGAEIIVPEIPLNKRFNPVTFINSTTGIITSLVGVYLLVNSISSNN